MLEPNWKVSFICSSLVPKQLTVSNIASICLANIYQIFKDDLKGYLDILIDAQLNLMNDESIQVRAIATRMLPTYNKPNDTVKAALISKLADSSEVVRYRLLLNTKYFLWYLCGNTGNPLALVSLKSVFLQRKKFGVQWYLCI